MQQIPASEFILNQISPLLKFNKAGADCLDIRISESGLDSLELMELVMAIEDQYEVKIDDALLMNTSITIGNFIDHLEQLVGSRQ